MEMFFDVTFLSILNIHTMDWSTQFVSEQASNIVSVLFLTLSCAILMHYIIGYFRLPKMIRYKLFAEKFTPILEGSDFKGPARMRKWYLILVPVFFFLKRLLFVSILITANDYLWV